MTNKVDLHLISCVLFIRYAEAAHKIYNKTRIEQKNKNTLIYVHNSFSKCL